MSDQLYRRRCDSVVHEPEGAWLENDTHKEGAQEPIVDKCLDWHPDLVWYEKVGIDYEAANQASMSMASRVIFYEDVVVIVNAALGIGGDDEVPGV